MLRATFKPASISGVTPVSLWSKEQEGDVLVAHSRELEYPSFSNLTCFTTNIQHLISDQLCTVFVDQQLLYSFHTFGLMMLQGKKTERSVLFIHHSDFNPKPKIDPSHHCCLDRVSVVRTIRKCFITPKRSATRCSLSWGSSSERSEVDSIIEYVDPRTANTNKACPLWAFPGPSGTAAAQDFALALETHHLCTKAHFVPNKIIFKI